MVMAEWRRKRRVQTEMARGEPVSPRHFGYDPRRSEYSKTLKERGITEQVEVDPETEQVREASEAEPYTEINNPFLLQSVKDKNRISLQMSSIKNEPVYNPFSLNNYNVETRQSFYIPESRRIKTDVQNSIVYGIEDAGIGKSYAIKPTPEKEVLELERQREYDRRREILRQEDIYGRMNITKKEEIKNELPAAGSNPRQRFDKLLTPESPGQAVQETAGGAVSEIKGLITEPLKGAGTLWRRFQYEAIESKGTNVSDAPVWVQNVLGERPSKTSFEPEEVTFITTGALISGAGGMFGAGGKQLTRLAIKSYPIIKTGEFLEAPSFKNLGSALASGTLVYTNIPEKASKVFSLDTLKALEADKSAKIGGRSARERAGVISKAELRKQSYQAQRNPNIFYDKGDIGVRLRSPELKSEQFTKERVVRFQPEGIVEIKDVQLGGRGRLVTRADESFQGKGSVPGFRKQYPEGYYSQSLNLPSGKQDLVGITMMRQSVKSNIYADKGKVPEVVFKDVSVKQFSKEPSESGYLITQRQFSNRQFSNMKFQESTIEVQRGFRPGMKQKVFERINEQRLFNERVGFISDISQSTDILPKLEPRVEMKVGMKELTVKKSLSGSLELPKFESVVLSSFRMDSDVASASKTSSIEAIKPQERYQLKTEQISSFKPVVPPAQPIKIKPTRSFTPEPRKPVFPTFDFDFDFPKPPEPIKPEEPPPDDIIEPPIDFWFPKMKLKGMKGFSMKKPGKRVFAYQPSIVGIAFKIKQPKTPKNKVFTGLEVRGI